MNKKQSDLRRELQLKQSKLEKPKVEPYLEMVTKAAERNGTTFQEVTYEPETTENHNPLWQDTTLKGMKEGGIDIENRPMSPKFFQESLDSMQRNLNSYQEQLDYLKAYNSSKEQKQETNEPKTEE